MEQYLATCFPPFALLAYLVVGALVGALIAVIAYAVGTQ